MTNDDIYNVEYVILDGDTLTHTHTRATTKKKWHANGQFILHSREKKKQNGN